MGASDSVPHIPGVVFVVILGFIPDLEECDTGDTKQGVVIVDMVCCRCHRSLLQIRRGVRSARSDGTKFCSACKVR